MASAAAVMLAACATPPHKIQRSPDQVAAFKRVAPCPSTRQPRGACPGWVVDHIVAMACGGPDTPANMQWQTVLEAKAKDRWELDACRPRRRATP